MTSSTSYLAGETPIPCVTCNRTVKFADLLARSRDLDAAVLATGHYVESRARGDGSGRRDMFTPADLSRDQSYFLFATTQPQLDYLRFPLGTLTKAETRAIAAELGLARGRQAGQPGHLLRAGRRLCRADPQAPPGGRGAGRHRRPRGPGAGAARGHHPLSPSASAGAWASPAASRSMW